MKITRRLGLAASSVTIGALGFLAPAVVPTSAPAPVAVVAAPQPAAAQSPINLQIVNVDKYRRMTVCKDWHQTHGHDFAKLCEGSPHGTLDEGENSLVTFGWRDTDAVKITKGRSLKWDKSGPNVVLWSCSEVNEHGTGYYKVSPAITLKRDKVEHLYFKACD